MSTAARETRAGEIVDVLRAAQLLVSGERGVAAEHEVLGLLQVMTGASEVAISTGADGGRMTRTSSTQVGGLPHLVRLTLPLRYGDEELGVLTIAATAALTVGQEQAATLVADLLSLHLVAGRRSEQLTAAAAERRRIAARFIEATEREHDELAGQLHDGPLQSLVAARYVTDMAGLAVQDGSFDEAREGVQAGLVHARRALWQLRPHAADGNDLAGALTNLAQQLADYIGLRVAVACTEVPTVCPRLLPARHSSGSRDAVQRCSRSRGDAGHGERNGRPQHAGAGRHR
jgi:signal transduction histidine kinase